MEEQKWVTKNPDNLCLVFMYITADTISSSTTRHPLGLSEKSFIIVVVATSVSLLVVCVIVSICVAVCIRKKRRRKILIR